MLLLLLFFLLLLFLFLCLFLSNFFSMISWGSTLTLEIIPFASRGLVVKGPTWLTLSKRFSHDIKRRDITVPRVSKPWNWIENFALNICRHMYNQSFKCFFFLFGCSPSWRWTAGHRRREVLKLASPCPNGMATSKKFASPSINYICKQILCILRGRYHRFQSNQTHTFFLCFLLWFGFEPRPFQSFPS